MVNLDIIKENIELEKSLGENILDTPFREDYLIPDTHPDVYKILSINVKPVIISREVQIDRVLLETQVEFDVIYLAKEENGVGVNNVCYKEKISNFIDVTGAEHRMLCDAECELEHINTNIINERKINIEAYFRTKCTVFKSEIFEFVKDIDGAGDLQVKKKQDRIQKNIVNKSIDMTGKSQIKIPMDKPQVGKIMKCSYIPHKKETKLFEDKMQTSCWVKVDLVYRAYESNELVVVEEEIILSNEEEVLGLTNDMSALSDFRILNCEQRISQDDLGESRIIDVEVTVETDVKVSKEEVIEVIDDAYSPTQNITLNKEIYRMNITIGEGNSESIIKDNIYLENSDLDPIQLIDSQGKIVSLEGKLTDGKVIIEGIINVDTIYKSSDEIMPLGSISGEIPFGCTIEIPNAKEGMGCVIKGNIESIQSNIEANTIAVKTVVNCYAKVTDLIEKEYVKEVEYKEELPLKKASIIIYVIQEGDTLWDLAKRYNTTIESITKLNDIENYENIEVGNKIIIPGRAII
ncbi:DUF3794 and LysM peptidoglycan-binding domain-containing protein [Clostridium tarantellae]|uniref:DUF3794 domain-containing protein n=1 Tax=Clostridium tarantellae TaxID=39493 RepID=A0A6I1MRV0_9CLOT|nr:SPOCS domain-containing protein [Clostridium tarantellae]MPQ43009.1 DUF3794 domain-containing protein [Clostridium tarantellae]